jgi:hypothetical protein
MEKNLNGQDTIYLISINKTKLPFPGLETDISEFLG